jgi:histidinol-phosphatase (PHP family)
MKFTYHSHSNFCDGKNTLDEMVLSAIEKGLTHYGFSSHAPVPFANNFAIKQDEVQKYLQQCQMLKEQYQDKIKLYVSMEFDYITDIIEDINSQASDYNLDYIIASVHMVRSKDTNNMWFIDGSKQQTYDDELQSVFGGNIRKGVETFFEQTNAMIKNVKPDIIGHFDKIKMHNHERYFSENNKWYEDLVMQTLESIRENHKTIIEINTRGLYKGRFNDYYPSRKWLKRINEMKIPVTISTDCHNVTEIDSLFAEAWKMLSDEGLKEIWYYEDKWKPAALLV